MKGSLSLGRVAQINIKVHWTFLLIFVWVVFAELEQGGDFRSILFNALFILVIFSCVVLHELGHALMARRFGITTKKITLLPIGGVASLEKMPEEPYQEFLVALAGPMVNVVIAFLLYFLGPVQHVIELPLMKMLEELNQLSFSNFIFYIFLANAGLVLFNLIPAFPMDGGRVLRALLAMYTDRVNATRIAAAIGQFIAVLFFLLGIFVNIFLVFIALFVFVGAYGENKMVQHTALLSGHKVREAMLTQITRLQAGDTLGKVLEVLLAGSEKDFVVSDNGQVVGVLSHRQILKNSRDKTRLVRELMDTDFKSIKPQAPLQDVLRLVESGKSSFFPVISSQGVLEGAIDMDNLNEFITIQSQLDF